MLDREKKMIETEREHEYSGEQRIVAGRVTGKENRLTEKEIDRKREKAAEKRRGTGVRW